MTKERERDAFDIDFTDVEFKPAIMREAMLEVYAKGYKSARATDTALIREMLTISNKASDYLEILFDGGRGISMAGVACDELKQVARKAEKRLGETS